VLEIIASWKFPRSLPRCAMQLYWRHFEAERRLLLPWKRNLEAGSTWKKTWYGHYHALSLEYICFPTANRLSLRTDGSAHCVINSCFRFCSVHVQQMSHWRSCAVGGPRALCWFIDWATYFKRLRTVV